MHANGNIFACVTCLEKKEEGLLARFVETLSYEKIKKMKVLGGLFNCCLLQNCSVVTLQLENLEYGIGKFFRRRTWTVIG